jgi:hypothetical protein
VPALQEGLLQTPRQKNVEIWFRDQADGNWPTWLSNVAPLILLAALWFFMVSTVQLESGTGDRQTGDPNRLASQGVQAVLAVEVVVGETTDSGKSSPADCLPYPWKSGS